MQADLVVAGGAEAVFDDVEEERLGEQSAPVVGAGVDAVVRIAGIDDGHFPGVEVDFAGHYPLQGVGGIDDVDTEDGESCRSRRFRRLPRDWGRRVGVTLCAVAWA